MAEQKQKTGQEKANSLLHKTFKRTALALALFVGAGGVSTQVVARKFLNMSDKLIRTAQTDACEDPERVFSPLVNAYPANTWIYGTRVWANALKGLESIGCSKQTREISRAKGLPTKAEFKEAARSLSCFPLKEISFEKNDTFGRKAKEKLGINPNDRSFLFLVDGKDGVKIYLDLRRLQGLMTAPSTTETFIKNIMQVAQEAKDFECNGSENEKPTAPVSETVSQKPTLGI